MSYTHNMRERVTYWPVSGTDTFDSPLFGMPEPRMARWQDVAVLFRDAEGREVVSQAVVYVDREVKLGGYLFRGVSAAGTPPDGAFEIRQTGKSPNLTQTVTLHKAML